jgi:CheY-like chemotaxis protein
MFRQTADIVLSGCRVLLVDDAPDNRFLISRILEMAGALVETANDGLEGIERAYRAIYDIVLMDLQMPRMDGFHALRVLREMKYPSPVVALTAHALADDRRRTCDAGFAAHLTKPVHADELIHCVWHWSQYEVIDSCPRGAASHH